MYHVFIGPQDYMRQTGVFITEQRGSDTYFISIVNGQLVRSTEPVPEGERLPDPTILMGIEGHEVLQAFAQALMRHGYIVEPPAQREHKDLQQSHISDLRMHVSNLTDMTRELIQHLRTPKPLVVAMPMGTQPEVLHSHDNS
jgi:hypothetical protein